LGFGIEPEALQPLAAGTVTASSGLILEVMMAEVRAELVANVVSVFVDEGEAVEDGDTLVMLESMKMEIPVIAEGDGTVRKIVVKEGDTVQRGDLIAVVD
jgi:acetyl-CoA carboxylase biotin carboxyl carrier protein